MLDIAEIVCGLAHVILVFWTCWITETCGGGAIRSHLVFGHDGLVRL